MKHNVSISIKNNCGAEADIALFHNSGAGSRSGLWTIAEGQSAGPLIVSFDPDDSSTDIWAVTAFVKKWAEGRLYASVGDTSAN